MLRRTIQKIRKKIVALRDRKRTLKAIRSLQHARKIQEPRHYSHSEKVPEQLLIDASQKVFTRRDLSNYSREQLCALKKKLETSKPHKHQIKERYIKNASIIRTLLGK